MDNKSKNKTARFLDALDDTIPRLLGKKVVKKEVAASQPREDQDALIQEGSRDARVVRFVHACGLLLVCTAAPPQIEAIVQHVNGTAPMSAIGGLGAALKLVVDAVFLRCWYQLARK